MLHLDLFRVCHNGLSQGEFVDIIISGQSVGVRVDELSPLQ